MKRFSFLVGTWTGEARLLRGPGEWVELNQSEVVQHKLDGLILVIEGVGRRKSDGQAVLQALGMVSFDDESGKYHMRAFNDGRFLETELKLLGDGAMSWGFTLGHISTRSVLRINESSEWTELAEVTIGSEAPKRLLELTVRRVR